MGYSQSSVAVRGKTPAAVLDALELQGTGKHEECAESPFNGAELAGGWYLVVSQRDGLGVMEQDSVLKRLSTNCEVVACCVEEHVMYSSASGWRNGDRVWSVVHNFQKRQKIEELETQGELPPMFNGILDRWRSEQEKAGGRKAGVDYIFEVPVDLARALTGYRHDRDVPGLREPAFEVLTMTNRRVTVPFAEGNKLSWFGRLFGR